MSFGMFPREKRVVEGAFLGKAPAGSEERRSAVFWFPEGQL